MIKLVILTLELRVAHILSKHFILKLYLNLLYHFLSFLIDVLPACRLCGGDLGEALGTIMLCIFEFWGFQGSSYGLLWTAKARDTFPRGSTVLDSPVKNTTLQWMHGNPPQSQTLPCHGKIKSINCSSHSASPFSPHSSWTQSSAYLATWPFHVLSFAKMNIFKMCWNTNFPWERLFPAPLETDFAGYPFWRHLGHWFLHKQL